MKFALFATQKKTKNRNGAFEERITEVKTLWDMARIITMEVKVCREKTHQVVGRIEIYAQEQDMYGCRKAG